MQTAFGALPARYKPLIRDRFAIRSGGGQAPSPETALDEDAFKGAFIHPVMISGADLQLRPAIQTDQRGITNLNSFQPPCSPSSGLAQSDRLIGSYPTL